MMPFSRLNNSQFIIIALGCALLARLLATPFFAHVDLFSEYRRVFFALEHEHYFDNSHRILVYYIEMFFAWLSQLFIPVDHDLFYLPDPTQSTANLTDYGFFLNDVHVYRYLFFFKLPYLLFDLGTVWVIWNYVSDVRLKRIAILLWLFNPLTFFSTYIFGRFEVISLFFLAATALALKHRRKTLACVLFGLSLWCREINILFAPFLALAVIDVREHWFRNSISLLTSIVIIAVFALLPDKFVVAVGGNASLFVDPNIGHETNALQKLLALGYHWFYPIVVCLAAVAFYTWEKLSLRSEERFVVACALVLFIFFSFNVHSVHYAAWLMIFPILCVQHGARVIFPFVVLWAVWLVLWLLKTDSGVFTFFLAAPLHDDFIGQGYFPSVFNQHIASPDLSLYQAIQIMRSIFAVTLGYFAYRIINRASV